MLEFVIFSGNILKIKMIVKMICIKRFFFFCFQFVPILLVISTRSMLILDQRTLQIKYRVPATEIYRMSLSPFLDDVAVVHVRAVSGVLRLFSFGFQIVAFSNSTEPHLTYGSRTVRNGLKSVETVVI